MSIEKLMEDWKQLALGTPQVPTLTTEFMYDWKTVNAWLDQHPEVDRDALVEAIRGGFRPIYPVSVGDGDWKPADQPMSMSVTFDTETFLRQHKQADVECGDGVVGD